jgi:hypothetical protein
VPKVIQSPGWGHLPEVGTTGRRDTRFPAQAPGVLSLVTTNISVTEGGNATITVSRSSGADGAVAVDYVVAGVTTTPQSGTLSWASGASGNRSASVLAGLVSATTMGSVTLSNPRRTDSGAPAPTLGAASGSITVQDSPPSGGEYTLANALAGVPFTVDTPIAPTITSTATVSNSSQLSDNLVNGRRVTLTSGTYSGFTINTTDQEFILQSGVTVTGNVVIGGSARRIIIRGNPLRAHTIRALLTGDDASGRSDIFINGINAINNAANGNADVLYMEADRFACINSNFEVYSINNTAFLYSGQIPRSNLIWGNNRVITSQNSFAWRTQRYSRLVMVDSLLKKTGSTHNPWRYHRVAQYCYAGRNQIEGSRIRINPDDTAGVPNGEQIRDVWYVDNDQYMNLAGQANYIEVNVPADVLDFRITNNRFYGAYGPANMVGAGGGVLHDPANYPTWTASGNSFQALPGTIPTWSFK